MNLRKFFLSALILTSAFTAKAEWTDVTNIFLANPNFENNQSNGWFWSSDAGSQTANYGCFEFWYGFFDFYQDVKLPKGNYRLTFQGYYRCADFDACYQDYINGREEITAFVHAGETQKPVESVFSFSFDEPVRGAWTPDDRHYYPNNMETAAIAFVLGAYQNTFEFSSDGEYMDLGLKCFEYQPSNWCIFTNFKLEYDGQLMLATGIDLTVDRTEIKVGEHAYCSATVLPEDAATKQVKWTSSNPEVAIVNEYGDVYGNGAGKAVITASAIDGSNVSASVEITVKEDDTKWVDVTNIFLTNPDFNNNTAEGWEYYSGASSQTGNYGCFEFWNGYFIISQSLKGMPLGKYRVSVQAFYRTGDNYVAYDAYDNGTEEITAELFGCHDTKPVASIYSFSFDDYSNDCWSPNWMGGPWFPNGMVSAAEAFSRGAYNNSLIFEYDNSEEDLEIGLQCFMNNYSNWCCFDNFKLEYGGEFIQAKGITATIDKADIIVTEKTQCHANITPENALFKNVTWESRNEKVATIDQDGVVTGVGVGSTLLVATTTDGTNLKAAVTVNVRDGASADNIVINEIMAANVDEYISPAFNFDGWMEIYNPTNAAVKLEGLYLSDEQDNLEKWKIPSGLGVVPPKGFQVVWFDSHELKPTNAPIKLDLDGGAVFLSDGKKVIAEVQYPEAMERVSYARTTDGGEQWGMAVNATPGKTNTATNFATAQLDAPIVDQPSQLFTTPLSVNVTIPAGTTLRYTTDGTLPTMNNGQTSTTGQFSVRDTKSYRFRLFADDMLPSRVTTRAYIFSGMDYYLPVVAVVSDPRFLYDDSIGVYVRGKNGRPGNGQSGKCNWNMDWDRPVNFSYLDAQGEMVLNQDVNLEMCGGWSRAWNPHAFKLKGNKELGGSKNLDYQFFVDKPYIRNRTLQVRNGGNDNVCRFKDPALQYIMQSSGIDIDVQSYQPVHEFINGEYIGVLNVREPNNKHYVYANYGWDEDEIDQFEMSPDSGYVQKCGTEESFLELVDQLSANAANSEVYEEIKRMLDIDEYCYYMAAQFYLSNWDWPQNNVKGFKYRDGGKYRFVCFDLDGSFNNGNDPFQGFMNKEWYTFDQLYPVSLGRISGPIKFVTLFRNLLDNDNFKRKFIDTYCIMGGSVFEANRAVSIINQLADRVNPAMRLEGRSVDNTANSLRNNLRSRNESAINAMRNNWLFDLSGTKAQRVSLQSDTEGADILLNDIQVPTGKFNGLLFQPVTLVAQAPAGYVFQGWADGGGTEKVLLARGSVWKYYDQGSLDNANWTSPTYNESGWKSGNAPLGYEKNDIATTLDYGNDKNNKRPTAYFRTSLRFEKTPKAGDKINLDFTIDDGLIVYVNGKEAGRYNMPSGTVRYNTFASTYAPNNPDNGNIELDPTLFHSGDNTIAVEVHNNSATSTDLYWDAAITTTVMDNITNFYSTEARIPLPEGNVSLTACYREMTEAEKNEAGFHPVCVNEVSASNNVYVNEYAKKNDWVELCNNTNEDIDIEGMYLTDNLDNKTKYVIAKEGTMVNTVIPAHGHLVIWCDKLQTTNKAIHASFKLAGEGGVVALTAADKSWTDVLQYGAHDGNSTVGRYPDGAQSVYLMNMPTIEKTNRLSSYVVNVPQNEEVGIKTPFITAANGLRIYYTAQTINVKAEDAQWARVSIFTTDGRMVDSQTAHFNHGVARIDVSHLPQGLYIARAEDDQESKVACKFAR